MQGEHASGSVRGRDGQRGSTHKPWLVISALLAKSASQRLSGWWLGTQLQKDRSPGHLQVCVTEAEASWLHAGPKEASRVPHAHSLPPSTPPLPLGVPSPLPFWTHNPRTFFIVPFKGLGWVSLDTEEIPTLLYRGKQSLAKELDEQENQRKQHTTERKQHCHTSRREEATGPCPQSARPNPLPTINYTNVSVVFCFAVWKITQDTLPFQQEPPCLKTLPLSAHLPPERGSSHCLIISNNNVTKY